MKSSKIPPVSQSRRSRNFTFSLATVSAGSPPVVRRLFEVNSEPHTGARPSVRLCVGLKTFQTCVFCLSVGAQARSVRLVTGPAPSPSCSQWFALSLAEAQARSALFAPGSNPVLPRCPRFARRPGEEQGSSVRRAPSPSPAPPRCPRVSHPPAKAQARRCLSRKARPRLRRAARGFQNL
jgi:hypothetical protein